MRILRIIHSLDPKQGGLVSWLEASTKALIDQKHTVDVLCLDDQKAPFLQSKSYPYVALGPALGVYAYTPRLLQCLKAHTDYDVLIVEGLWQYIGYAVYKACMRSGIPYVVYPHGMLDPWFNKAYPLKCIKKYIYWWLCEYRVLKRAAAVVFTSDLERAAARRSFFPYGFKEAVLPLGVALSEPISHTLPQASPKPRSLLFLGRIHPKKGVDILLEAWAKLLKRHPQARSCLLRIAGPSEEGYLRGLKAKAQSLGVESSIEWLGMQDKSAKDILYKETEAFILPSHQENFAMSVVENLAASRPVLISKQVNIWPQIEAAKAGLVAENSIDGVLQLLEGWLAWSPEELTAYSKNAYQCYQEHFRIETAAQALSHFLNLLCHERSTS
jgi:glycosyltransferase involved in cell wall biosynthesis